MSPCKPCRRPAICRIVQLHRRLRWSWPSRSPVLVLLTPSHSVASVGLVGLQAEPVLNLVAAPKQIGSRPVANRVQRARVPGLCRRAGVRLGASARRRCSTRPSGLSSSSTPCKARALHCRRGLCQGRTRSIGLLVIGGTNRVGLGDQRWTARPRARWSCRSGNAGSGRCGCCRRLKKPLRRKPAASFSALGVRFRLGRRAAPRSGSWHGRSRASRRREVIVTMPMRGSFSSRAISCARSRWIWSATRKLRHWGNGFLVSHGLGCPHRMGSSSTTADRIYRPQAGGACEAQRPPYSVRATSLTSKNSSWSPSLMSVVVLQLHAALEAFLDLA